MRYNYCGPQNVINTHVAEEQIHGLLEAPAPEDQSHQAEVGHHDKDVNQEEEDEGRDEGLGCDL